MLDSLATIERIERKIDRWIPSPKIQPIDNVLNSDDPIDWIQSEFYIPETNGPIQLYPHQIATLRESQRKDDKGNFKYNLVIWSDIKKSAKSCIVAAMVLYRVLHTQWASAKIIANDLKQADSRVAFYLRRALELNPRFEKDKNYHKIGYTISFPNHSTVEAIPIDPGGEAGGNDDMIVFSELWDAKHKAYEKMWTEMTLSPTKFGRSQRWVESYAGYSGESPILERIYERGLKGEKLDLSYTDESGEYHDLSSLEIYRSGSMLMLWNTVPRLPFQTPEYYIEEESNLLPTEFQRVHRNQWVGSTSKFVEKLWWQQCYEPLPPLTKGEPAILAADAPKGSEDRSYLADSFALVLVTRHPHNPKHVAPRYCGIWQPEKGQLLDFDQVEKEIRRLIAEFSILEFAYDPYQLHDLAMRLRREGIVNTREFKQGADRLEADKQLRDVITGHRIAHDGNPLLTEHIDNANVVNHGENGIRLVKRQPHLKIDGAVALSMGVHRCYYYNLG